MVATSPKAGNGMGAAYRYAWNSGSLAALALALAAWAIQEQPANWRDQGVLYLDHSLNARLHTVPVQAVHIRDGFWSARRKVTTERSLPTLLTLLEEHGVVDNFRRLGGPSRNSAQRSALHRFATYING